MRAVMASRMSVSVVARFAVLYRENNERERVDRDLLPLPLNEVSDEDEVDSILQEWEEQPLDEIRSLILTEKTHRLGQESWAFVMICALNYMNTGRDLKQMQLAAMQGSPTKAQSAAIKKLHEKFTIFKDYTPTHDLESLWDDRETIMKKVQLNYYGEEVHPAKEMTWEQLQPATPEKGKAGQVRLLDLCGENVLADVVRDPAMLFKPEEEWPTEEEMRGRDKRNWCSDGEWIKICCGCSDAGVFEFLRPGQLLTIAGVPVLHNCMGVGKDKYLPDGREVLRMEMDVDVTNQILRILLADIRSLPYPGQWNAVSLEGDDLVMFHSGTDLTCAYFALQLEHTWWKFLAFNGKLSGKDIESYRPDLRDEPELYACWKCLAMGLNSAS